MGMSKKANLNIQRNLWQKLLANPRTFIGKRNLKGIKKNSLKGRENGRGKDRERDRNKEDKGKRDIDKNKRKEKNRDKDNGRDKDKDREGDKGKRNLEKVESKAI